MATRRLLGHRSLGRSAAGKAPLASKAKGCAAPGEQGSAQEAARGLRRALRRSERQRARLTAELDRLREAEAELRAIIDSVPSPIAYIDADGFYRRSNRAHQEWHRHEAGASASPGGLIDVPACDITVEHFEAALEGRSLTAEMEASYAGAGARWVEVTYTPRRQLKGLVSGVVVMVHDASDRRRAELTHARLLAGEKEARAAAELANQRLALLAEASAILSSSLDPSGALDPIANLVVRKFADCCTIELAGEHEPAAGFAIAHRDPDAAALFTELRRRCPPELSESPPSAEGPRSGEARQSVWFDDVLAHARGLDGALIEEVRALLPDAAISVQMVAHGRVVGRMQFGRYGRAFSPDDKALCEDLAQRAAAPVDNARAYRAERAARLEAERIAFSLSRLQAITSSLSGALTPSQVAEVVVREGIAALRGAAAVLLVPSPDGDTLEILGHTGFHEDIILPYQRVRLNAALPLVNAYRRREPELIESLDTYRARYPEVCAASTAATGTRALFCLPLLLDGVAIGAFGVTFREDRRLSAEEFAFALTLARQCAQALDRARLYEAELRSNECLRLLAQAGDVLSSSLDYETTLQNVASLALPTLGDFCFFDMVEGADVRRLARAHDNPATEAMLAKTRWERCTLEDLNICALSSGTSGFHPEVDDGFRRRVATSPEHLELLRSLGICSLISVPLRARNETLGALTLCFAESHRHHTPVDLVLAEELARRAATAVENARLHAASREATLRAQEATRLSEQANRAKDEFLGVVSHELRTPLNAILGWAQLLSSEKTKDPTTVRKGVTVIERNARAQVRLVEDILDVSRIIAGKLRLELRPVDIEPVLRTSAEVVRPAAEAKGVELVVSAQPGAIVSGDPDRLQQAVWNLVSNAVKFTPQGGAVEVALACEERRARILVRDSGSGIEPSFLPYVFDRFRQADSSTTRRHGGLGLGLAIVRHLVELHGGSVAAHSEGLGKGAAFTIELPLRVESAPGREPPPRAALEAEPDAILARLDGLKVLVVDDELDAREMLSTLLHLSGAEVTAAGSAADALTQLEAFPADVLVSDVGMPGDDGYALIRHIRASGASYARVPALALTAYAAPDDARRAAFAGFQAHLSKPADPAVLTALIASLGGKTPASPSASPLRRGNVFAAS